MNEIKDGSYTVAVTLSGGSGRAKIKSPAELTVDGGKIKAKICWDSPYYDYMEVGGEGFYPVNEGGNSVFVIDAELDREIPAEAETVAMSEPHMIAYTLYFDSGTLRREQTAAAPIALCLLAAAVAAAMLIMRKRKKHDEK